MLYNVTFKTNMILLRNRFSVCCADYGKKGK